MVFGVVELFWKPLVLIWMIWIAGESINNVADRASSVYIEVGRRLENDDSNIDTSLTELFTS